MVVPSILLSTQVRLRLSPTVHAVPLAWARAARFMPGGVCIFKLGRGQGCKFLGRGASASILCKGKGMECFFN